MAKLVAAPAPALSFAPSGARHGSAGAIANQPCRLISMSNKDAKRKKKEEKQAAARRKDQVATLLVRVGAVILVPLVLYVLYTGLFGGPPSLPPDQVGAADHVRGNLEADVTLTLYADFQCPACLNETQVIARAWPQIQDRVRVVYRYFPLDVHRFSFQAARYAEAAALQGKFWEMHDLLFASQPDWTNVDDPTPMFDDIAQRLELDLDRLHVDIESPEVRAKIVSDQQGGISAGVRSTPALFINGQQVPNPQSAGGLISLIDEAAAG